MDSFPKLWSISIMSWIRLNQPLNFSNQFLKIAELSRRYVWCWKYFDTARTSFKGSSQDGRGTFEWSSFWNFFWKCSLWESKSKTYTSPTNTTTCRECRSEGSLCSSSWIAVGNEYADDANGEGNESKESLTAVAATTAATSWARSKLTSSCRAARGSDWSISERNEDGWEMDSSYASARMEILDFERKRTVRLTFWSRTFTWGPNVIYFGWWIYMGWRHSCLKNSLQFTLRVKNSEAPINSGLLPQIEGFK